MSLVAFSCCLLAARQFHILPDSLKGCEVKKAICFYDYPKTSVELLLLFLFDCSLAKTNRQRI